MFAYNKWANTLFLDCLADNTIANAKIFLLMSHVILAEEIWLCRLKGKAAPNENLWKEYAIEDLQLKENNHKFSWKEFLESCSSKTFAGEIHYQNNKGQKFKTAVADVLNHVINHGTYHRAQIAGLLRQEGINPPLSDYVFFVRREFT